MTVARPVDNSRAYVDLWNNLASWGGTGRDYPMQWPPFGSWPEPGNVCLD